jgi:hypothetical protein
MLAPAHRGSPVPTPGRSSMGSIEFKILTQIHQIPLETGVASELLANAKSRLRGALERVVDNWE